MQASYIRKAVRMGLPLDESYLLSQLWKNTKKLKTKYNKEIIERVAMYCPSELATFDIVALNRMYG
jgi:predicted DNA-binding protein